MNNAETDTNRRTRARKKTEERPRKEGNAEKRQGALASQSRSRCHRPTRKQEGSQVTARWRRRGRLRPQGCRGRTRVAAPATAPPPDRRPPVRVTQESRGQRDGVVKAAGHKAQRSEKTDEKHANSKHERASPAGHTQIRTASTNDAHLPARLRAAAEPAAAEHAQVHKHDPQHGRARDAQHHVDLAGARGGNAA